MPDDLLFDTRQIHPGKHLQLKMEEKGWDVDELAKITGLSGSMLYSILGFRSNIGPDTAKKLAAAFGDNPVDWLKWDAFVRLSQTDVEVSEIERMARLYEIAPIRDMQRRGWIAPVQNVQELEAELRSFFGHDLASDVQFPVAFRRSDDAPPRLSPNERAWLFRARQLATAIPIEQPFNERFLEAAKKDLRRLAAFRKEAEKVSRVLAKYGIRLVVVEPIPNVRIDGAAFWIGTEPVIALSLRFDRIDGFWFTLMHEFFHIYHGDAVSVDADLVDSENGTTNLSLFEDEIERRANDMAAATLIAPEEIESFIRRIGPLYSKERVIQFSHKMKIHPGIVVGQLQNRKEVGYSALRDQLVKVRELVISTALTDGWNQTVAPTVFAR